MKEIHKRESGQVMILALILLVIGSLVIAPLMGYMGSGLIVGRAYEEMMDELYAADAGIEDAIFNIITPGAPYYDALQGLDEGNDYTYTLSQQVNGISPVSVTITKLSLIQGLIGEDEYKIGQPHEDWVTFDDPQTLEQTEEYVEYLCQVIFHYDGPGNRKVESIGAFFYPYPGENKIDGSSPYDIHYIPVITSAYLEDGSPETKMASGGFAFIWRWQHNKGPEFDKDNRDGELSFRLKVYDPAWIASIYFIWATFKEQDISYVTNAPDLYKWLAESTAEDTKVISAVLEDVYGLNVLTWEINPPQ